MRIEKLLSVLADPKVAAASGFVVPRRVRTLWERGRYVEYLLAFTWYKPIQDYYDKPLISSGCFSIYRTASLALIGGWSARTLAEDMDLTWEFYLRGFGVPLRSRRLSATPSNPSTTISCPSSCAAGLTDSRRT